MPRIALSYLTLSLFCLSVSAADWPQFRADAARSGYSEETLPEDLSLNWVYGKVAAPDPAWEGTGRMFFDHAYHTTIADGILYFGSSADCKVYALDAKTGEEVWSFFTDAPVRFAPTVWKDRVFAISDDGFLYCLSADKGEVLWKKKAVDPTDMLLGNDRMVSRWPIRGGIAIRDDVLYMGAGIWPTEGFFLFALDPETGKEIWLNDKTGQLEMDQPHPTARAKSGPMAQGYLAVNEDVILVPAGRAVPAAFNRNDGELRYFHLQENRAYGGSPLVAFDGYFFNNGVIFDASGGALKGKLGTSLATYSPEKIFYANGGEIKANDLQDLIVQTPAKDRKGNDILQDTLSAPSWELKPGGPDLCSMIVAGNELVFGKMDGKVSRAGIASREVRELGQVEGKPLGLAVACGRLFVSTDKGRIYCFGLDEGAEAKAIEKELDTAPYGADALYVKAAEEIVEQSQVTEGYCLDLNCGEGNLAFELAKRTNLRIYGVDSDPEAVARARERLDAAGLYGTRVTILERNPEDCRLPDYFADLLVSGRSVSEGEDAVPKEEMNRMLRPYGGVVCIGKPGEMETGVRGEMEGSGDWTHLYCTPANTICSDDTIVSGPLRMLWFRDADQEMPSRHGRGPAPLFSNGRLIVEGMHNLRAVNAYNGRTLWEYPLPDVLTAYNQDHLVGAAATGSNFCVAGESVYVGYGDQCLRIDIADGKKISSFRIPSAPESKLGGTWGYIACVDGILYGSIADVRHIVQKAYLDSDMSALYSESIYFFAMDAETGEVLWDYTPEHSIRNNTIAIGSGKVYLIDRPKAEVDRVTYARQSRRGGSAKRGPDHEPGTLLALDAKTGSLQWKTGNDIYGTMLALSQKYDILLMGYQFTRFRQNSEVGDRLSAIRASNGERLWDIELQQTPGYGSLSRPIVNDKTVYLEPHAYNLQTGERLDFEMRRSYGCGIIASSSNVLVFRSATFGYVDLQEDLGTENYGGIRPGCWINAIPVGGLVLMPDATSGCTCSYLNRASVALQPDGVR